MWNGGAGSSGSARGPSWIHVGSSVVMAECCSKGRVVSTPRRQHPTIARPPLSPTFIVPTPHGAATKNNQSTIQRLNWQIGKLGQTGTWYCENIESH